MSKKKKILIGVVVGVVVGVGPVGSVGLVRMAVESAVAVFVELYLAASSGRDLLLHLGTQLPGGGRYGGGNPATGARHRAEPGDHSSGRDLLSPGQCYALRGRRSSTPSPDNPPRSSNSSCSMDSPRLSSSLSENETSISSTDSFFGLLVTPIAIINITNNPRIMTDFLLFWTSILI